MQTNEENEELKPFTASVPIPERLSASPFFGLILVAIEPNFCDTVP
jgi:hypothetical protein